jgi:uncharacterized SAM-binding protein YcdF (DUF218 family)
MNSRRLPLIATAVLLVAGAGAYVKRQAILTRVAAYLIENDTPSPAGAIVVLSGSVPDRMLEAVDLYHAGLSSRIILTREGPPPGFAALQAKGASMPERHDLNRSIAIQLGVPSDAITVIEGGFATSTVREADLVIPYLRSQGIHSLLLVTSKLHSRRAGIDFRSVADGDLRVTVCASHYDPADPATWWHYRGMVRRVVFEYQKLLVAELWDRWQAGWAGTHRNEVASFGRR